MTKRRDNIYISTSTILILIILLCIIMLDIGSASAQTEEVEIVGNASGLVLLPPSSKLFNIGNLHPGDKITKTLKISNKYSRPYTLYMRAERIGEEEEENDLLNELQLTITYNGDVIYEGSATGTSEGGSITQNISLGKINPNQSYELIATISLNGPNTCNEYQGKEAQVKWIFTAQTDKKDKDKDKGKDKDKDKEKPPIITSPIEEPESPPIEEPEPPEHPIVVIEDEPIPAGPPDMPKTGEGFPYPFYIAGAAAILLGVGMIKKNEE